MQLTDKSNPIHRLTIGDKTVILVGTAHVSRASVNLVAEVIAEEKPDTVCVELCPSRYEAVTHPDRWRNTDIFKIIKEKKAFLLLSNLILSAFQRRLAEKFDIKPGQEMIQAIESAKSIGATIHLADRDIQTTLSRVWRGMGLWVKAKVMAQVLYALFDTEEITEEQIESMKERDVLESILSDLGKSIPALKRGLIDERDQYLAEKIKTAPGNTIVAVVGAGHMPGILANWGVETDLKALEQLPQKSKIGALMTWLVPAAIVFLVGWGFYRGGVHMGTGMLTRWLVTNSLLAGVGTLAALGHPVTILAAILSAPLTTLHPLIAVGWVAGLVEVFYRKPKVLDFENLPNDILTVRGFWKNQVTRILLVVVFSNLGCTLGTLVAIPLMLHMI
jgi:pheromone shutdown-related protein TraB